MRTVFPVLFKVKKKKHRGMMSAPCLNSYLLLLELIPEVSSTVHILLLDTLETLNIAGVYDSLLKYFFP